VFFKHGARGPLEVPGIHLVLSPHQPHLSLFTQSEGLVEKTSHWTFKTPKLADPS